MGMVARGGVWARSYGHRRECPAETPGDSQELRACESRHSGVARWLGGGRNDVGAAYPRTGTPETKRAVLCPQMPIPFVEFQRRVLVDFLDGLVKDHVFAGDAFVFGERQDDHELLLLDLSYPRHRRAHRWR